MPLHVLKWRMSLSRNVMLVLAQPPTAWLWVARVELVRLPGDKGSLQIVCAQDAESSLDGQVVAAWLQVSTPGLDLSSALKGAASASPKGEALQHYPNMEPCSFFIEFLVAGCLHDTAV